MQPLIDDTADAQKPRTLADVINRLHAATGIRFEVTDEPPPPEPERIGCPLCAYHGWVIPYNPERGGDHRAVPCECRAPVMRQRAIDRAFRDAAIPEEYEQVTFQSYGALPLTDCQPDALVAAQAFAESDDGSIFFHGPVGTGKTALAVCIQRAIVLRNACSTLFVTTIDLLDRLRATYGAQSAISEDSVLSTIRETELLVLDDVGRERRKSGEAGDWVRERMFAIVNWRQTHHLRTVYTSNQTIPELAKHLDDAIAWRINAHCKPNLIDVAGRNLREGWMQQ